MMRPPRKENLGILTYSENEPKDEDLSFPISEVLTKIFTKMLVLVEFCARELFDVYIYKLSFLAAKSPLEIAILIRGDIKNFKNRKILSGHSQQQQETSN